MAWHESRYPSCLFAVEDERPVSGFDLHVVPRTSQRDIPNKKAARSTRNRAALIGNSRWRAESVNNHHVINHAQIACVRVIDTHASAGFDCGLDHFTRFVHNMATPVE